MTKFVIDTNLYIHATRSEARNRDLEAFYRSSTPFIHLHSVVAAELLAGATGEGLEARTWKGFIRPFERVNRVITPGHESWTRAGRIIAELVRGRTLSPGGIKRSFFNDCVIAASTREYGFILVTENTSDYERISTVEPLRFMTPWPKV